MKAYLVCSLLVCAQLILSSCQQESQEEKQLSASSDFESQASISSQPFMGMVPTDSPVLLFPDLIGSSLDEYNGTFSPDGREFFFTTNTPSQGIICYMSLDASGQWTEAEVAAFSGTYSEYDPLFLRMVRDFILPLSDLQTRTTPLVRPISGTSKKVIRSGITLSL
jgi:hypothetical protein